MNNLINLKNISKTFLNEKKISVLKKINYSFSKGKVYSLMGPSGSGKSTLLNILSMIDKPSKGSLLIDNKEINFSNTSINDKIRSKKIGILKNIPKKFEATRYHSLIIDKKTLSNDLLITAETNDGIIMGIQHKKFNIHGVQFHPESIKTRIGIKILRNFLYY